MTKTKLISGLSFCILLSVILGRCTKDKGALPVPQVNSCDTITYTKHIKPIMEKYCTACHGDPLSGGAPVFLNTYTSVKTSGANGSLKKVTITQPTMPLGADPLSQADQSLITCWLENGYKE